MAKFIETRLYHTTTVDCADSIMLNGFRDNATVNKRLFSGTTIYTPRVWFGVFTTPTPNAHCRYYVGDDQMIYDLQGDPTGYELIKRDEEVYISGEDAWIPVSEQGNVGDYLPFEET